MKEKDKVKMNSLMFVGKSVLDLSKILIYEFYHNHATPNGLNNRQPLENFSPILLIKT